MKHIKRGGKEVKKAKVGYNKGGMVGTKMGLKPTNTAKMTARGGGKAERGTSFKG